MFLSEYRTKLIIQKVSFGLIIRHEIPVSGEGWNTHSINSKALDEAIEFLWRFQTYVLNMFPVGIPCNSVCLFPQGTETLVGSSSINSTVSVIRTLLTLVHAFNPLINPGRNLMFLSDL